MDSDRRLKSAIAMLITALALLGILAYGRRWWNRSEAEYDANVYKPMQLQGDSKGRSAWAGTERPWLAPFTQGRRPDA